ncbi:GNAT family N-acetyltransferase [Kineococcus gynurae]|uniref:GNAT family N-acetyltransferase n=1 Tax=Kineococcus gynurae TaxID=452979 RepID=A0ABV5LNB9_9ACTN
MRHVVRWQDLVVGARVVVRHRHPDGSAGDALGELVADDGETLTVETRRGPVVVARSAVLAAKGVPPAPARRAAPHRALDAEQLQRVTHEHWRSREQVPLGDWLLRAHDGFSSRANSALAVGDPGRPLAEAVAAVEAFYAQRGLPPLMSVPGAVDEPTALTEHLAGAGWTPRAETLVMTAARLDVEPLASPPPGFVVEREPRPSADWLSLYRGGVPEVGVEVLCSAADQVFVSVRETASPDVVAVGRGSLSPGWLGLSAVEVCDSYRRRGLATLVLAELLRWGATRSATSVFLQVTTENTGARAMWSRAGFEEHSRYHYRAAPTDD